MGSFKAHRVTGGPGGPWGRRLSLEGRRERRGHADPQRDAGRERSCHSFLD